jgi:hypothetical protein
LRVIEATPYDYRRMAELPTAYASLRLRVVDTCVVALAERLDVRQVAALDHRDFLVLWLPAPCAQGDGSACCQPTEALGLPGQMH